MPRKAKRYGRYKVTGTDYKKNRRKRQEIEYDLPKHPQIQDLGDPRVREIQRIIQGEHKEAEQIATLERNNPNLTIPELVTMNWLNANSAIYVTQASLFGGRSQRGGAVPDYLVRRGPYWDAWLVNGTYYHSSGFQERHLQGGRDLATKLRLEGANYMGFPIENVIMLNEDEIYEERPFIFELAMMGMELP